mgnify:FL=1
MDIGQKRKISVLLVDFYELVRVGISRLIDEQDDMFVAAQAGSGDEALEVLASEEFPTPDVILMDARMPGLGGIEATKLILEAFPDCKVVAMSTVATGVIPSQILRAGARGFITKSAPVDTMLGALRAVNEGNRYVTPELAANLSVKPFNRDRGCIFNRLSRRELQISIMLTDGKRVSEIASILKLSPKTVYSYRYRIFEKMGIRSDIELTILAVKHGLTEDTREFDSIPYRGRLVDKSVA